MRHFLTVILFAIAFISSILPSTIAGVSRHQLFEEYPEDFYQDVESLAASKRVRYDARRHLRALFEKYDVSKQHRELFFLKNLFNWFRGDDKKEGGLFQRVHLNVDFAGSNNAAQQGVQADAATVPPGAEAKGARKGGTKAPRGGRRKRVRGRL